jgi:raffinose/stachyose/melibiose transport system substrate-binding protein
MVMEMLRDYGGKKVFEIDGDQATASFANGEAAMWLGQGSWFAEGILANNPDFELGVAPMPINDDPNSTLLNLSTSTSMTVSPTSKNKEIALDFINYMLDEKDSSAFYESLMFNPVIKQHTFTPFPWVDDVTKYVSEGKAYDDPRIPSGVKTESEKIFQSFYAKDATREDVVKALDKAWQESNKINK